MERFEKKTEILHDLLQINKHCFETFERSVKDSAFKPEMYILLQRLSRVWENLFLELRLKVVPQLGDPADAVDLRGEIYKSWQESDHHLSPGKRSAVIHCCEKNASAVRRAYESALEGGAHLPDDIVELLYTHLTRIKNTMLGIRKYKSLLNIAYMQHFAEEMHA